VYRKQCQSNYPVLGIHQTAFNWYAVRHRKNITVRTFQQDSDEFSKKAASTLPVFSTDGRIFIATGIQRKNLNHAHKPQCNIPVRYFVAIDHLNTTNQKSEDQGTGKRCGET
jgi:hypothetical protein